jgi:SAM-dependent methyltransferase
MATLLERAKKLQAKNIFLGGPLALFEIAGRKQLTILLKEDLYPESKVLDIGCGCLRGGYWLIHFLEPGCYFGIEPNRKMLEAGIKELLEPGLIEAKRARFDNHANFDFSVFGENFDFFVARSIWTHASKSQIRTMLDGFVRYSKEGSVFLTSYVRASFLKRDDYKGEKWIGKSHDSDRSGVIKHKLSWIQSECQDRGMLAEEILEKAYNFSDQTWLKIKKVNRRRL